MKLSEKITKPIIETKYLNVENTDRYRTIIRFFYEEYEKLKYWMYQEEVYEELVQHEYFNHYTMDQCQQDLSALVEWKNLMTMQDTKKVSSIEEFKNKKFRYQLSEYTVEIERMVLRLENLFIEGASLEPSLLERIKENMGKMEEISQDIPEKVYTWWNDINNDFVRLNQNYQDYMRDLNSLKAEEMMKTREFLLFKDKLVEYLRSFVQSLQVNVGVIEQRIKNCAPEVLNVIFQKVLEYEMAIPRMDVEVKEEEIYERIEGRFQSIKEWFVDTAGRGAEADKVFDTTNEVIRKITRYATRISELSNSGENRKEEYRKLALIFDGCKDIKEAHCLSANVFGIEQPLHLKGDFGRETDSINSGVYDEKPAEIMIKPRTRTYREKAERRPIIDRSKEKQEMRQQMLKKIEREKSLMDSYIVNNSLDFKSLPVIEPEVRNTFLIWLSKGLAHKNGHGKTEDGREYTVHWPDDGKMCTIKCTDGVFQMPEFVITFSDDKE